MAITQMTWFDSLVRTFGASTLYGRDGRLGLAGAGVWQPSDYGVAAASTGAFHFAINNNPRSGFVIAVYQGPGLSGKHFQIAVDSSGFVVVYDRTDTPHTGVVAIPNVTDYRAWEIRYVIHASAGAVRVRLYEGGGATDYAAVTGIDTKASGSAGTAGLFQNIGAGNVSDIFAHAGTDWFASDAGIGFSPLEAVTTDQGTPVGAGTTLDALVDINAPGGTFPFNDGDNTYSRLIATGLPRTVLGTVTLPSPTSGNIIAVAPIIFPRRTDTGVAQFNLQLKSGATVDDNSGEVFNAKSNYLVPAWRAYHEDPNNPGNPFASGATVGVGIKRIA